MSKLIEILQQGGVAVMPTDTIYGVVGRALKPETVERVYRIKGRQPDKPCIILIAKIDDVRQFGAEPPVNAEEFWPGPVSVILDCNPELANLHRGTGTLAFRLPADEDLRALLIETGPLIAPSANPEGEPPAATADEAHQYFGGLVDHYEDGGERRGKPSRLIRFSPDGGMTILRP